jgi:imidazoleglycerol-phosphate dehydratase
MSTQLQTQTRAAEVERKTKETEVRIALNLDGSGRAQINTGVAFLDHMLELFTRHGLFDLEISCRGDLHIDDHHSVEDVGITLGQAFAEALGDKAGIARYGAAYVPMDEALCRACVDLSGRFFLVYEVETERHTVGTSLSNWRNISGARSRKICVAICI